MKTKNLNKEQLAIVQGYYLHDHPKEKTVYTEDGIYKASYIEWLQKYVLTDITAMITKMNEIVEAQKKEGKNGKNS